MRLPVKLGVLDPVDERDAVMVLDADEPAVAVGVPVPVAVSVGEGVAPGRDRVAVGEIGARDRVAGAVAVPETEGAD